MARDTLSLEQIIRTAVDLLDAEGLDGLNMRALGKQLGSAATAVYWHVRSKDNLVLLATDHVWGELELPAPDPAGWRAAAAATATDLYAMFLRHPWLVQAFASHVLYGENKARHDDHCLALHEAAGFTPDQADQAAAALFTYALGNAAGAAANVSVTRKLGQGATAEEAMSEAREIALRYPRLRARVDTPAADYGASPDNTFRFGLDALLDGLERQHLKTPRRRRA